MSNYKEEDEDNKSYPEHILLSVLENYEAAFNKTNPDYDLKFQMTLTNHKQAMPDGNKDVAYLRIERAMRKKGSEEEWNMMLVNSEMHIFKSMNERVNPKAPWKEQLFVNLLGKLTALGLEYSEYLRRTRDQQEKERKEEEKKKLDLVITDKLPAALTEDDKVYQQWIKDQKAKEGIPTQ